MSSITIQQAIQYAQQAGFSGSALYTAVAIAIAESGLNPQAQNKQTSTGVDRGIVQFNSTFHPEVSDACAYDPGCAFREFYRVSQGGKNFNAWCTYNKGCANPPNSNGPYKQYLSQVQAAAQGLTPMPTTPTNQPTGGMFGGALDQIKVWGEYAAIFVLALFFILAGFYLMNQDKVNNAVKKMGDVAIKAALV